MFLTGTTLLLTGIGRNWWGWMAKLQFYPSVLRIIGGATLGNIAILAFLLALTLIFGRIYCSVICPLGVFQDSVIWLRRKIRKKKFSYRRSPERVRNVFLAAAISLTIIGSQLLISFIAPYSAYGRMVGAIVAAAGGTLTLALGITAGATLAVVVLCSVLWGRAWCNTICPVGTLLGYLAKLSLFKVHIDTEKCKNCGSCGRDCKASCIDTANHTVDHSRCVDCFDCIGNCKFGAITYGRSSGKSEGKVSEGRRRFLGTTAALAGTAVIAKAQDMKVDGGLAEIGVREEPQRKERLVPFGAGSVRSFYDHCTSCQLCISTCPNDVLHPSTDLGHLLQPVMGYTRGYCRPECTACSDVCPAGAIRPVRKEEKLSIKIGTAHVNAELCLAARGEEHCGNCERHCPVGAIKMVEADGVRRPAVMEEVCIGCGECEYLCPVRPVSAITVDGIAVHHKNS